MKEKIKYILYIIVLAMIPVNVFAETYSYRGKEMNVVYIIGIALLVIRIFVPILLIVTGMIGLIKAMTQNSDANITKEVKKLVPKLIAALIIFMLPTILTLILGIVKEDSLWSEYGTCLLKPFSCNVKLWDY